MRLRRGGRALLLAVASLMGTGPVLAQTPPPPATVETLAGPGFCNAPTVLDTAPSRVGALAVDADGRLFTDLVDAPGRGVINVVDGTQVTRLTSNEPAVLSTDPLRSATVAPAASRLAPGAAGAGVVVAAGPRVVEVDASPPSLRVIAGTLTGQPPAPVAPSSGDGGVAEDARFTSARSVTADAAHNLYIADQEDAATATFVIRFVNRGDQPVVFYAGTPQQLAVAPGTIQTITGVAGPAPAGDGGPARSASLHGVPPSMAVVGSRLYVASYWNGAGASVPYGSVRVVNLGGGDLMANGVSVGPGRIETVAGGPAATADADGGSARDVALSYIPGVTANETGGLYLVEQARNRVRFVDSVGRISTFAGAPGSGSSLAVGGLGLPAAQAVLDRPVDVKIGGGRRVFISDEGSGRVLVVDSAGLIHLAAGSTRPTRCVEAGATPAADREVQMEGGPYSVVAGEHGDTYFVNLDARRVMRRDVAGTTTVVLAAGDSCPPVGACATSGPTELRWPAAVAFAHHGLYIYDVIGARVLFLNVSDQVQRVNGVVVGRAQLEVVAGTGSAGSGGDGGPAVAAQLGGQVAADPGTTPDPPFVLLTEGAVGDITIDDGGDLFIGDGANHRVRRVDGNGVISTVAGRGAPAGAENCCTKPSGLAVDAFGNLYVSDMATRQVWFLNRSAVTVEAHGQSVPAGVSVPLAGTGTRGFGADGPGLQIALYQPTGLVSDGRGNLYIAEYQDQTIRRLDASGNLSTVAGTGVGGFNGDGLPPRQAALFNPTDVAIDPCGNLLVADFRNDRVRRVDLAAPCENGAAAPGTKKDSGNMAVEAAVVVGVVAVAIGLGALLRRRRDHRAASHASGARPVR